MSGGIHLAAASWFRWAFTGFLIGVVVLIVVAVYRSRKKFPILAEFFAFLLVNKKWWLIPIATFLVLLAVLIILSQGAGAFAPFVYSFW